MLMQSFTCVFVLQSYKIDNKQSMYLYLRLWTTSLRWQVGLCRYWFFPDTLILITVNILNVSEWK